MPETRSSTSSRARRSSASTTPSIVPRAGGCVLIPAGARHHVRNPGAAPLFFLTIYAPPAY